MKFIDFLNESKGSNEHQYMMLSRLESDCNYFINQSKSERTLWANNIDDQIKEMKDIWNSLDKKPEWLSMEEIDAYEKKMKSILKDK